MQLQTPAVMVSSTFFDLREIRQQLARFVEAELGYRILMSESSSFPVEPDAHAIENCRRRVEKDADILVLVVGERYGFVDARSGKSVTNLEYIAARAKGILIYTFVAKKVLTLFQAWRDASPENRGALAKTVEDDRVFGFVDSIRNQDGVWMFEFENADDIVRCLRVQLAYQMCDGLNLRATLDHTPQRELLKSLSPLALRLALDLPDSWEYLLFAQVLSDEVKKAADLRRQYDLGLAIGKGEHVDDAEFSSWCRLRLNEISRLSETATRLLNVTLQEALGPSGVPGSMPDIVFVARQLGRIYMEAMAWSARVMTVHPAEDDWNEVTRLLLPYSKELVTKLGAWGDEIGCAIREVLDEGKRHDGSEPRTVKFTLTLESPDPDGRLIAAMRDVYRRRGVLTVD